MLKAKGPELGCATAHTHSPHTLGADTGAGSGTAELILPLLAVDRALATGGPALLEGAPGDTCRSPQKLGLISQMHSANPETKSPPCSLLVSSLRPVSARVFECRHTRHARTQMCVRMRARPLDPCKPRSSAARVACGSRRHALHVHPHCGARAMQHTHAAFPRAATVWFPCYTVIAGKPQANSRGPLTRTSAS